MAWSNRSNLVWWVAALATGCAVSSRSYKGLDGGEVGYADLDTGIAATKDDAAISGKAGTLKGPTSTPPVVGPPLASDSWVVRHVCQPAAHAAHFTWAEYDELLAELRKPRYRVVPMRDFEGAIRHADRHVIVGLRHDSDGSICKCSEMAEREHAMGISSTYFILHTEPSYGWGLPRLQRREAELPRYRELEHLGHEVGLHFDGLTMALEYGLDAGKFIGADLDWLRSHGLHIVGASAHGSGLAKIAHFVNYEIFASMNTQPSVAYKGRSVKLGTLHLADFALQYEAYHVGYKNYLSDSGGKWNVPDPIAALRALAPGDNVEILVHPLWWGRDDAVAAIH